MSAASNPSVKDVQKHYDDLKEKSPVYWNAITHHRNTKGEEMVFYNRLESRWVFKNIHKFHHIVIQKCSQVGMTELLFNLMMYHLKNNRRVLFLIPNDSWRTDYVRDRINGLIKNCPEYKANYSVNVKDPASMTMKTFYDTVVKFAGAKNILNLYSYPADVIMVDEYDLCNQENLIFADDRTGWKTLKDEQDPFTIKIGNPSIENWGINKQFKLTNQYFWFAECEHCGHSQLLDWQTHFVEKDPDSKSGWKLKHPKGRPICVKCGKDFDRRGKGAYKLVSKGKRGSLGIQVSKLRWDVSNDAIDKLFNKWEKAQTSITEMENFYNQHLGLPFEDSEYKITRSMLIKCAENGPDGFLDPESLLSDTYVDKKGRQHRAAAESIIVTVAGIDQGHGKGNHIHISMINDRGIRTKAFIGRCFSVDEIEQKLDEYNVHTCVIDSQGGGLGYNELRSLCERRTGQVYMCRYRPKDKIENLFTIDENGHTINANRTDSLDASFDAVKHQRVVYPKNINDIDNGSLVPQMIESVRVKEVGKDNLVRGVWKNVGPDDHRHADNYELLAAHLAGYGDMEDFNEEDKDESIIEDYDSRSLYFPLG